MITDEHSPSPPNTEQPRTFFTVPNDPETEPFLINKVGKDPFFANKASRLQILRDRLAGGVGYPGGIQFAQHEPSGLLAQ